MHDIPARLLPPLPIAFLVLPSERLCKLGALAKPLALPVKDVDGDGDKDGNDAEDGGGPFELEAVIWSANVAVDCALAVNIRVKAEYNGQRGFEGEGQGQGGVGREGGDIHGAEYNAAIPARKSRARPLPPVAGCQLRFDESRTTRSPLTTGCIRSICGNHIVDRGHVDGVLLHQRIRPFARTGAHWRTTHIGNADQDGEDHRRDPMYVCIRTKGGPRKTEQTDGF